VVGPLRTATKAAPKKRGYTEAHLRQGMTWDPDAPDEYKPKRKAKRRRTKKAASPAPKKGILGRLFG
jgi:hypothetical protein